MAIALMVDIVPTVAAPIPHTVPVASWDEVTSALALVVRALTLTLGTR